MRKTAVIVATVLVALGAAPAFAQQEEESILIDIVLTRYGAVGEVVFVREVPVDAALVGATCTATATTENNSSEHPNNDFLLTSGGATAVIPDFERVAGATVSMTAPLMLGETIAVNIRLGGDGVTSEGVLVALACTGQPPPTTTQPPQPPGDTTTTTQPPPGDTTTTEAPPVGGVEAGGGSSAGAGGPAGPLIGGGAVLLAAALGVLALGRRRSDAEQG